MFVYARLNPPRTPISRSIPKVEVRMRKRINIHLRMRVLVRAHHHPQFPDRSINRLNRPIEKKKEDDDARVRTLDLELRLT